MIRQLRWLNDSKYLVHLVKKFLTFLCIQTAWNVYFSFSYLTVFVNKDFYPL